MSKLLYGASPDYTESYRFAFRKHPLGVGLNANTLPKHIRHLYLPPPGYIFGVPDLSQAEVRVVAYLSQCKDLLEIFQDPKRNVHQENAAMIIEALLSRVVSLSEIIKDSPEYVLGKAAMHAFDYREGPWKFSWQTGIEFKQSRAILDQCKKRRPEIPRWHDEIYETVKRTGMLRTPTGEERIFHAAVSALALTGKIPDHQWKEAVSWIPQTLVPRITNRAMMLTYRALPWLKWHMQWHDAFVVSMPVEKMIEFARFVMKAMHYPVNIKGKTLIIPTNLEFGYTLGDLFDFTGKIMTREEWSEKRAMKLKKTSREQLILDGTYGVHLSRWARERGVMG